jgi:hypothetical protein
LGTRISHGDCRRFLKFGFEKRNFNNIITFANPQNTANGKNRDAFCQRKDCFWSICCAIRNFRQGLLSEFKFDRAVEASEITLRIG